MRRCRRQVRLAILLASACPAGGRRVPQSPAHPRVRRRRADRRHRPHHRLRNVTARRHQGLHARHDDAVCGEETRRCSRVGCRAIWSTATLHVQNTDAWISRLTKTGSAPLPAPAERPVAGLAPGDRVPDQTFVDQDDAPLTMEWTDGHVSVVTFIYTRCPLPDFCPAIDRRFVELQTAIKGASGSLADVRLLSVSIDPAFDRPAVLKAHAAKLGADPNGLAVRAPRRHRRWRPSGASSASTCGRPGRRRPTSNTTCAPSSSTATVASSRCGPAAGWTAADLVATLRAVAGA